MTRYTIGVDFGTLSARAVLVDATDGRVIAEAEAAYANGVMDAALPDGTPLPKGWALQQPQDYMDTLCKIVNELMSCGGADRETVAGIGLDFTSCTVLPVNEDNVPLCLLDGFKAEKHAYAKLWKHHAAQAYADKMTAAARERGESWLDYFGGSVSCEAALPKLMELRVEAPEVYQTCHEWLEAGDWIVRSLTGCDGASACAAGFKRYRDPASTGPENDFFAAVDMRFADMQCKLPSRLMSLGETAGHLLPQMAERLGLMPGIPVAPAVIDAHACMPAAGIYTPGQLLMIMGTSACHILLSDERIAVPGISGAVTDGIIPGLCAYEAGQSCVGDMFSWFIKNCVGSSCLGKAQAQGMDIHAYLSERAARLRPGESGLLALDWFNGNRSTLNNFELSGLILGLSIHTRPEEIYRALLEAAAYGSRMIIDNYRRHGIRVDELYATGGISLKNPLMMQIYADVMNMPIRVADVPQGAAAGSAIYAALAAGLYKNAGEAIRHMACKSYTVYEPQSANTAAYGELYARYEKLYSYFGTGAGRELMEYLHREK